MPKVNGKHYPYTSAGKSAAKKALKAMVRSKVKKDGKGGPGVLKVLGKAADPTGMGTKIVGKLKDKLFPSQNQKDTDKMKKTAENQLAIGKGINKSVNQGIPTSIKSLSGGVGHFLPTLAGKLSPKALPAGPMKPKSQLLKKKGN